MNCEIKRKAEFTQTIPRREGGRRKPTGNIRQRETYPCRDSPPMDNRIITLGDKSLFRGLLAVWEVILPVSPP